MDKVEITEIRGNRIARPKQNDNATYRLIYSVQAEVAVRIMACEVLEE